VETVIDTDGQILFKFTNILGTVEYLNAKGELHRIGGPAITWWYGTQEYWVDGKRYRTDGPAVIWSDGTQLYWVAGIEYTEEQYPKAVLEYKLKQLVG
jgi:hypothetical protein